MAQNYQVVDFEISVVIVVVVAFAASSVDFTFLGSQPCFEASTRWQEIARLVQLQAHACHKDYNPSLPTIPLFLFESYQLFLSFYSLPFP